jgi:hypothetical protein
MDPPAQAGGLVYGSVRKCSIGAKLRVPIVWLDDMKGVTCDFGSVGLEFFSLDQPSAVIRLQWAFDKPEEWQAVVDWAEHLRAFLEQCLAAAN